MDSPAVFFDRLDSEGEFAGWVSKNAPSYAKEEMAGRSLHEVLDKLILTLTLTLPSPSPSQ